MASAKKGLKKTESDRVREKMRLQTERRWKTMSDNKRIEGYARHYGGNADGMERALVTGRKRIHKGKVQDTKANTKSSADMRERQAQKNSAPLGVRAGKSGPVKYSAKKKK